MGSSLVERSAYTQSLRMYFANITLQRMFFDDRKNFGNVILKGKVNGQQQLADLYNNLRDEFHVLAPTLGQVNSIPPDLDVEIGADSFAIEYLRLDKERGLLDVLVGLPTPVQTNECWGVVVMYNTTTTVDRFFTLDFAGYADLEKKGGPLFLLCEFENKDEKTPIQSFSTLDQALHHLLTP